MKYFALPKKTDELLWSITTIATPPNVNRKQLTRTMLAISVLRAIPIFLLLTILCQGQECYFPDGSQAMWDGNPYVLCNTTTGQASACCGPHDVCTTTGLCFGHAGLLFRGGCTDKSFFSAECPSLCAKGNSILNVHGSFILDSY